MKAIRVFIAIELPESVKSSLAAIQREIKSAERDCVKWVAPDNIHLTLKFLGDVDANRIPALADAMSAAGKDIAPFRLNLDTPGAFPNTRNPRVIWVGLAGEMETLHNLQRNIENALIALDFPREDRNFSPHLTLGRVRDKATPANRHGLGEAVSSLQTTRSMPFDVSSVNLIQSTLTREGAVYNRLATATLAVDECNGLSKSYY